MEKGEILLLLLLITLIILTGVDVTMLVFTILGYEKFGTFLTKL